MLYERLVEMGIARKLINIALVEMRVPHELAHDAAQEIRMAWIRTKAKTEFSYGEVASYGHRIARHAALRARRELGSPVRLPGSAFRKRSDGTASVTPGILAAPLDWNDIEERLNMGGEGEIDAGFQSSIESYTPAELSDSEIEGPEPNPDDFTPRFTLTPERAELFKAALTTKQWAVLSEVLGGKSVSSLERDTGLKHSTLTRQLSSIRNRLQSQGLL